MTIAMAIGSKSPAPSRITPVAWDRRLPPRKARLTSTNAYGWDKGVRLSKIRDGLSNTILFGEKHIPLDYWGQAGWDCSTYDGDMSVCSSRSRRPEQSRSPSRCATADGCSAALHPTVCNFVFVDGSVHSLSKTTNGSCARVVDRISPMGRPMPPYE